MAKSGQNEMQIEHWELVTAKRKDWLQFQFQLHWRAPLAIALAFAFAFSSARARARASAISPVSFRVTFAIDSRVVELSRIEFKLGKL